MNLSGLKNAPNVETSGLVITIAYEKALPGPTKTQRKPGRNGQF